MSVQALVTQLKDFRLTKAEVLMLLNVRPGDLGLLDCVIEELDERMTGEKQEEVLRVVSGCLGGGAEER